MTQLIKIWVEIVSINKSVKESIKIKQLEIVYLK